MGDDREMSKERLKEVDEWLIDMKRLLSSKTEVEDIEYMQRRIDLFERMRLEVYRLYGGDTFKGYIEQNKHYREVVEKLYKFDGNVEEHSALADMLCGELLHGQALESESE